MALRMEQSEFFDFLTGGQKIAFDTLGKKGECFGFDVQTLLFQTALYPLRQSMWRNGFGF